MPFLPPNQQRQSTEGSKALTPTSGLPSSILRTPVGSCTLADRHQFHGLFSRTTQVSWHQKDLTNLDLMKQEMMG